MVDKFLKVWSGQGWIKNPMQAQSCRSPAVFWVSAAEALSGFHSEDLRKNKKIPLIFQQDGGEGRHFEICPEHSVLNKAGPQEELFYQSIIYWGFIRTQLAWGRGEGYLQLQPPPAYPIHRRRVEKRQWEALMKTKPGDTGWPTKRPT